jgi:hypothetical protein
MIDNTIEEEYEETQEEIALIKIKIIFLTFLITFFLCRDFIKNPPF